MHVIIIEEWRVIDRWWTDNPISTEWVMTTWYGRTLYFYKRSEEKIWRIRKYID